MADSPDHEQMSQAYWDDVATTTERYLNEGLDPAHILSTLAAVAIKTAQIDPVYKDRYLNYFAEAVRAAVDVTIVDE